MKYEEKRVDFDIYEHLRVEFYKKQNCDFKETTTGIENDTYAKFVSFENGAQWCERISPYYETVEVIVKGVKVEVQVKLLCVEFWSTERKSMFYYSKY